LLALMEWEQGQISYNPFVEEVYAEDYSDRNPRTEWENVWVLLNKENVPVENMWGNIDFKTDTNEYKVVLNTEDIEESLTGDELWNFMVLNKNNHGAWYGAPSSCPEWFIPVPGNKELKQLGFCVMKYEASYEDATTPNSNGWWATDWNTVKYVEGKKVVSKPGLYPIADVTQEQAIKACKAIWGHLITNKEWMTIARNIEQVASNWSSGKVWEGYIYNGVSDSDMWCKGKTKDIYTWLPRDRATKTGPGWVTSCDSKRVLTLSNWEKIWDFAGNVREHVNKADTVDGSNYNVWHTALWDSDSRTAWDDADKDVNEKTKYGPSVCYSSGCWVWQVRYDKWVDNNIFLRGGNANNAAEAGVFTLNLLRTSSSAYRYVGFRCVK
jgi:hypothetical protein